jgi:oligopeptide transport system substrate-binding protein
MEAHGERWTDAGNLAVNGPFHLEEWRSCEALVLSRNPDYHGRAMGNVERVHLVLGSDARELMAMYEAGILDIIRLDISSPDEVDRARRRHAAEYVSPPVLSTRFMSFDVRRQPFADLRVRQALVMATDRDTLCDVVLRGYRFAAGGGFVPAGMPGHLPGIALPYDPDQARKLLAEAGYAGGGDFPPVEALAAIDHASTCEYLQELWRENLGVDVAWQLRSPPEVFNRVVTDRPHLTMFRWQADYPDPDSFLRVGLGTSNTGWDSETYLSLVEEARHMSDRAARTGLYSEAERILVQQAPIIPLDYGRDHVLLQPWVHQHRASAVHFWFWKDISIEPH